MSDGRKRGWRRVKFGEVVRLNKEISKDPAADGLERHVGLEHIEPGDLRIRSWGDIADGTTFTNRFRPGQVLFGKRRAYQRKVAVADFDGVCSGDIYVFEPKDPGVLLPELLPFICQTDAFFDHAISTSAGSLSPRTNWKSLAEYELALPPLEEQRRRVARLQAVADIKDAARSLLDSTERLRKSYLVSRFRPSRGNKDWYPSNWKVGAVADAGDVQLGQKRAPSVHAGPNMHPYLRVANVFDDELDLKDVFTMHFADRDLPTYLLRDGDILLNEGQSTDLLGRSAIWRGEVEGMCFQMTLLRFRASRNVLPEFAHAYFQHMLYTKQFARVALRTTSIAHLSASKFERLTFPIPPMSEQRAFVQEYAMFREARRAASDRYSNARRLAYRTISMVLRA
jgi:type I restriction enzyme, S subunit